MGNRNQIDIKQIDLNTNLTISYDKTGIQEIDSLFRIGFNYAKQIEMRRAEFLNIFNRVLVHSGCHIFMEHNLSNILKPVLINLSFQLELKNDFRLILSSPYIVIANAKISNEILEFKTVYIELIEFCIQNQFKLMDIRMLIEKELKNFHFIANDPETALSKYFIDKKEMIEIKDKIQKNYRNIFKAHIMADKIIERISTIIKDLNSYIENFESNLASIDAIKTTITIDLETETDFKAIIHKNLHKTEKLVKNIETIKQIEAELLNQAEIANYILQNIKTKRSKTARINREDSNFKTFHNENIDYNNIDIDNQPKRNRTNSASNLLKTINSLNTHTILVKTEENQIETLEMELERLIRANRSLKTRMLSIKESKSSFEHYLIDTQIDIELMNIKPKGIKSWNLKESEAIFNDNTVTLFKYFHQIDLLVTVDNTNHIKLYKKDYTNNYTFKLIADTTINESAITDILLLNSKNLAFTQANGDLNILNFKVLDNIVTKTIYNFNSHIIKLVINQSISNSLFIVSNKAIYSFDINARIVTNQIILDLETNYIKQAEYIASKLFFVVQLKTGDLLSIDINLNSITNEIFMDLNSKAIDFAVADDITYIKNFASKSNFNNLLDETNMNIATFKTNTVIAVLTEDLTLTFINLCDMDKTIEYNLDLEPLKIEYLSDKKSFLILNKNSSFSLWNYLTGETLIYNNNESIFVDFYYLKNSDTIVFKTEEGDFKQFKAEIEAIESSTL